MADESPSLPRREVLRNWIEQQRDPFMEAIYPGLVASGNPSAGRFVPPGAEGPVTGPPASPWERLAMAAQYFGNALPFRGGLAVGDKGLRALLEAKAMEMTDQAGPISATTPRPFAGNIRNVATDPGGWQNPDTLARTLKRWLRLEPDPELPEMLWEKQRIRELQQLRELLNPGPRDWVGPSMPPSGPGQIGPWGP